MKQWNNKDGTTIKNQLTNIGQIEKATNLIGNLEETVYDYFSMNTERMMHMYKRLQEIPLFNYYRLHTL